MSGLLLTKPVVAVVAATKSKAGAEAQWREGNGEDREGAIRGALR